MLIYISTILAHIAYNMYVEIKNKHVLSKLKPKQLVLEYHMTTIILTLDESRTKIKSVIDENNKKTDENHNNLDKSISPKSKPKQLILEYHKKKSTILTLDESQKN